MTTCSSDSKDSNDHMFFELQKMAQSLPTLNCGGQHSRIQWLSSSRCEYLRDVFLEAERKIFWLLIVNLRMCPSMSLLWEHLPQDARALLTQELRSQVLHRQLLAIEVKTLGNTIPVPSPSLHNYAITHTQPHKHAFTYKKKKKACSECEAKSLGLTSM